MYNKKILLKSYYNKLRFNFDCEILHKNNIEIEIEDRSNQTNFRIPQSGYFEADIFVDESDFDSAYNILKGIDNS